ncbi:MAG: hypothetical protein JWM80_5529 [Cyanobacteria bacterium RYN_339]|nr:hypothetical protein [Cyanobacteria bacterium RYN_339]
MLAFFYGAAGVALLLMGAGIFWAAYQVVYLLKHVRLILLPQVELTLTEVQKSLNHIDELAQDVDTTVEGANQIVATANRTVQSIETSVESFNKNVAVPTFIRLAATKHGLTAAWQAFRAPRPEPKKLVVFQEPGAAPEIGVLQP